MPHEVVLPTTKEKTMVFVSHPPKPSGNESGLETAPGTMQTELPKMRGGVNGPVEIESDKRNTTESITPQIESSSAGKSLRTVNSESPLEESKGSLETLSKGVSDSMSLIDNSVKHLHGLMTSIARIEPDENKEMPLSQIDRVKTATACAHQIYQLLKVKVEAVKVYADVACLKGRK